jgi:pimeloyl-ACP methyl ester carboxylesterase
VPDVSFSRVELPTGVALHLARGGRRDSIPLVLLPAYTDSWFSWSRILPSLSAELDVVAVDLRGHGDSGRPASGYGVDDVSADIVALLDALGVSKASLIGHSGSCFAARRVAALHPSRVAALGLIGSPVALDRARLPALVDSIEQLVDPIPEAFVRDFQMGASHVPLPDAFLAGVVAESRKVPARVWRAALDGLLDYRDEDDLRRIRAPTTLIWGDRDTIVTREDQDRLRREIADARLVVLPDTGHSPHWERPEAVAEILRSMAAEAA